MKIKMSEILRFWKAERKLRSLDIVTNKISCDQSPNMVKVA